jgi:hypothetical protein
LLESLSAGNWDQANYKGIIISHVDRKVANVFLPVTRLFWEGCQIQLEGYSLGYNSPLPV